jgi:hypothetical protein
VVTVGQCLVCLDSSLLHKTGTSLLLCSLQQDLVWLCHHVMAPNILVSSMSKTSYSTLLHLSYIAYVFTEFYSCDSVNHKSYFTWVTNKMQFQAVFFIVLQNHCACFVCPLHPSSGVRKTVVATTRTSHRCTWLVPVVATTVLRTDDGCNGHTKHAQWFCSTKKRLLRIASCWLLT